ncbi:MAG TPA: HEPN domain-containing protein [Candidatus Nanoarchaeia archaeon]|nr:HEPN domain-containing protein [Candidatus Nanoarchaeia archaeon]
MRQDVQIWWLQSEDDFDAAEYNFKGGKFFLAAFMSQQAVEKALKALFLQEKKGVVPQSHSLVYLSNETGVPHKFTSFLRELTPKFIDTRYPDAAVDLPSRIYDQKNTEKFLVGAKEVISWVKTRLK